MGSEMVKGRAALTEKSVKWTEMHCSDVLLNEEQLGPKKPCASGGT